MIQCRRFESTFILQFPLVVKLHIDLFPLIKYVDVGMNSYRNRSIENL